MNNEYSEYSAESENEEDCINPNEMLLVDNPEYMNCDVLIQEGYDYKAIRAKYEIEPDTLTIIKAIGKGYFSDVHVGMLSMPTQSIAVAVKTSHMKTGAMNAEESEDILRRQRQALKDELSIFAHLQSSSAGGHENVLKLLGAITTVKTSFCILTEYCECGSLDSFLHAKWKNGAFEDELVFDANENEKVWKNQRDSNWADNYQSRRDHGSVTTSDLMWFALQIARAMQFLAAMNVIHRDIAVRNVLLKSDFTLKVADFGLSRKLKENDDNSYYCGQKGTALPIRYIAPESLKSGRFSITSEYWSFGVVVWELFTFAEQQPYSIEFDKYGKSMHFYEFLAKHLSSGHRLSLPEYVPQQIKNLLSRLWLSDPKRRPSFQVCRKIIRQELMESCPNILSNEKASHHASEHSLFHFDDEDVSEEAPKTLDYTQLEFSTSAPPAREIQRTVENDKERRKKVKRRVGYLAVVFIAILTALVFTLLYILFREKEYVTFSTGFTTTAVSPTSENNTFLHSNEEATKLLRESAEQGNAYAQFNLGKIYQEGKGVNQSDEEAVKWYRKSAEQGNGDAQNKLGVMYMLGKGMSQSDEEAVIWFRKSAEQGYAKAQNSLGLMYQKGRGVPQSDEEAVKWYAKAAEQGNASVQFNLGMIYEKGQGVNQSYEEAVKWYTKSAEQGYASAQFNLGNMYRNGRGVPQSFEDAVKWYRKAADQGNAGVQYNLGVIYEKGQGVNQSDVEAIKWYRKAADQGLASAQYNLGVMYRNGQGVNQSDVEAVKWYKKAANQGHLNAQTSMGIMLVEKQGNR